MKRLAAFVQDGCTIITHPLLKKDHLFYASSFFTSTITIKENYWVIGSTVSLDQVLSFIHAVKYDFGFDYWGATQTQDRTEYRDDDLFSSFISKRN